MTMRNRFRKALSHVIVGLCALAVLVALVPLAFVLFYVVTQGIGALNLDFFRHVPVPVGETGGGMANAIVGTVMIVRFFGRLLRNSWMYSRTANAGVSTSCRVCASQAA